MEFELQVKYFNEDIERLKKISIGDWIDLRASDDINMNINTYTEIPLGIGMILPKGYEAHILPRSSTFKKYGIIMTCSMGIIDNSYSGNNDQWMFPAYAFRKTIINKGDRICQFRIVKCMKDIAIKEVFRLNDIDRGGIGSTGSK